MCKTLTRQNFDEWIDHWFVYFIGHRNGCRYTWKNLREVSFEVFASNFLCAHIELSDSENFIVEITMFTIMNTITIMDLLNISICNTVIPKLNLDFSSIMSYHGFSLHFYITSDNFCWSNLHVFHANSLFRWSGNPLSR